jgi:hypothetical protein
VKRKFALVLTAICGAALVSLCTISCRAGGGNGQSSQDNPTAPESKANAAQGKGSRLLFASYDGSPTHLNQMDYQINTLDVNQPSQFVHIGDVITGTKFKVIGFKLKRELGNNGVDYSELTVQNIESDDNAVLVLNQTTSVP